MKATSRQEAWKMADEIFPTDYIKDEVGSRNAGYDVFESTINSNIWISDLGNSIEVNLEDKTIRIWIEEEPKVNEEEINDVLEIADEVIYTLEDKISQNTMKALGIDGVCDELYEAFAKAKEILARQNPNSNLIRKFKLNEA